MSFACGLAEVAPSRTVAAVSATPTKENGPLNTTVMPAALTVAVAAALTMAVASATPSSDLTLGDAQDLMLARVPPMTFALALSPVSVLVWTMLGG